MERFDSLAYVSAVAPAVGLPLSAERVREVAAALDIVVTVATPALDLLLPAETEPAPVFRA